MNEGSEQHITHGLWATKSQQQPQGEDSVRPLPSLYEEQVCNKKDSHRKKSELISNPCFKNKAKAG